MGITSDNRTKRRATGGMKKHYRKKRKFDMGRQPTHTKIGEKRVTMVRMRGGRTKPRAIRLDSANFAWATEAIARKARILNVVYNGSSNELVRTNTLVKNCIIQIDATPFRAWYEQHYGVHLGKPKKVDAAGKTVAPASTTTPAVTKKVVLTKRKAKELAVKQARKELKEKRWAREAAKAAEAGEKPFVKGEKRAKTEGETSEKPAKKEKKKPAAKDGEKPAAKGEKPAAKGGKSGEKPAAKDGEKPAAKDGEKPAGKDGEKPAGKDAAKTAAAKKAKDANAPKGPFTNSQTRQYKALKHRVAPVDPHVAEQFLQGRLYACVSSRPGQDGCADGYILEGKELDFYMKKMQKKKGPTK